MQQSLRIRFYVAAVATAATLAVAYLAAVHGAPTQAQVTACVVLSALGIVAELLAYVLPRSAKGSVSFIPFLAAVVISPNWFPAICAGAVRLFLDTASSRPLIKRVFNSAQLALSLAGASLVFLWLGGAAMSQGRFVSLAVLGRADGLAALAAFSLALLAHSVSLSAAIALSSSDSAVKIWRVNSIITLGLDIAAGPLVFVFAWIFVAFGPFAAAAIWVPILGLRQVHRANLELTQMNQELLELMVKSIEARDSYTSGHSRRVQQYAVIISRAVGLSAAETQFVGRAALLHDVGKIHEKYGPILTKADRLTPSEWALMKEHPVDGANLVATMTRLKDLVPAVRHHHENWDGTGYPDGIAGEKIPMASRIIMFADTIDAMTTERPYRGPLPQEVVRSELVAKRGRQFDPGLTDQLLSSDLWHQLFPRATADYSLKLVRENGAAAAS